jgi:hypothetical protein
MPGIFLSYRRDDGGGWSGRVAEELRNAFPGAQVFQDVVAIRAGEDFTIAIAEALSSCQVLVALIGPRWLDAASADGQRRLADPDDLVRREIATALARGVHVLPVLVGGARMPGEAMLPKDLELLARRQAHEMSEARWEHDRAVLLDRVGEFLGTGPVHDRGARCGNVVSVARELVVEGGGSVGDITGVDATCGGDVLVSGDVEVARRARVAGKAGAITGVKAREPR